ncbi:unnamed protein product [Paramecium pentaurelia]|uniref:Uncharacterized protein n=1 Tax=Paramecium pentaurelia TaxID=43138 RepID=A0A8S1XZP0_9CILI|nr:unnamed protein product [Paramecium pentaurelia]
MRRIRKCDEDEEVVEIEKQRLNEVNLKIEKCFVQKNRKQSNFRH